MTESPTEPYLSASHEKIPHFPLLCTSMITACMPRRRRKRNAASDTIHYFSVAYDYFAGHMWRSQATHKAHIISSNSLDFDNASVLLECESGTGSPTRRPCGVSVSCSSRLMLRFRFRFRIGLRLASCRPGRAPGSVRLLVVLHTCRSCEPRDRCSRRMGLQSIGSTTRVASGFRVLPFMDSA